MRRYVAVRCRLDDVLAELGLRREHVTERTGIPKSQLSRFALKRRMMPFETAVSIAEAIGVDPRLLYEWSVVKKSEQ